MCEVRDKKKAFAEYVEKYAVIHNMSPYEVLKLAIFRLEGIEYEPTEKEYGHL